MNAGLQSSVGQVLEAEGRFVVVRNLLGIAHDEFNVVRAVQGEEIFHLEGQLGVYSFQER